MSCDRSHVGTPIFQDYSALLPNLLRHIYYGPHASKSEVQCYLSKCFICISFCFLTQVQAVLRRHWNQYKIQFEHSFSHSDAMRTASYTVSSISDVQGYSYNHDCTSEHLNGKGYHDMESVVLKTEKMYG